MTDIEKLRELAEKATKGPWKTHLVDSRCVYADAEHIASTVDSDDSSLREENDAAYIAAANPSAVIELLDELTRLRAQVERMWETEAVALEIITEEVRNFGCPWPAFYDAGKCCGFDACRRGEPERLTKTRDWLAKTRAARAAMEP